MSDRQNAMKGRGGEKRITRRQFLRAALTGAAALLAGCVAGEIAQEGTPYRTPTPFRVLASPQAPAVSTPAPVVKGSISLEQFMQFSSLLTGVDNLDPNLGRIYLTALQSGTPQGPTLVDVYGAASSGSNPPQDLEALNSAGFFNQEGYGALADQIITMWYTGVYKIGDEERVATFVDALAWKVLTFTKPLTICAQFGFWATEPQVQISSTIQYTPVPTQPGGGGG